MQNLLRQRPALLGAGSAVRVAGIPRFFGSLLIVWLGVLFFPGITRAQDTGSVSFLQSTYTVDSGVATVAVAVVFTGSTDTTASVNFSTSDGTATSGVNYVALSNTLSFAVGVLTDTVNVAILGDSVGSA